MAGAPGAKPELSAARRRGGSHEVMVALLSMPGAKWQVMTPPARPSISVGTNHDEIPGPVAIASQTCSGVPGTSTSTWTERRPEGSFFTLMMAPWKMFVTVGARQSPVGACVRRAQIHRGSAQPDLLLHLPGRR